MNLELNELFLQLPLHVYWLNRDNTYLGCNEMQAKTFGLKSPKDIIGKKNVDLQWHIYNKDIVPLLDQNNLEVINSGKMKIVEEGYFNQYGQKFTFLSIKKPLWSDNQVIGMLGASIDITSQIERENELESTKNEIEVTLENIIANLPGHVYWKDKSGKYLGCNISQAKSLGYSIPQDIIGKTDYDLSPKELADSFKKVDLKVIESGLPATVEEKALIENKEEALYLSKKVPLYNKQKKIIGILGISFDITEQRRIEKKLLETQHKLEGMTLVSASIAHETRTPLQSLDAAVGSLKKYFPIFLSAYEVADKNNLLTHKLKPSTINLLTSIMDSMQREIRLASLVVNLLQENLVLEHAVSSNENLSTEVFSITHCVNEALERYPFKTGQKERLHWQPSIDFEVRGKELLLTHVLFNFIKNALYYIAVAEAKIAGKKGEISIWLETGSPYNKLYFKDTGTGIEAHKLPYIFERFFTKTDYGAGIGLSYCKAAMEKLGGQVACESVEGNYTLFILSFPIVTES